MENVGEWLVGIGFSAIVGGIAYMLTPKGATERAVRIFVSLFILSVAVTPIARGDVSFSYPDSLLSDNIAAGGENLSDTVTNQLIENVSKAAEQRAAEALKEFKIKGEISVTVEIVGDEITVSQIIIEAEDGYENIEGAVKRRVEEFTGAGEVRFE